MNTEAHKRVGALDGLRGIAILMVLLSHTGWLAGGRLGVDVFFVLSGFLITTILLTEQGKTGSISIVHFYIRRALRLFPALALMVLVVVAGTALFDFAQLQKTATDAAFIALYIFNWLLVSQMPDVSQHQWMFSHVWSLSVEEQFYIVWPTVLIVMARLKAPPVAFVALFSAGIIYSTVARAILYQGDVALDLYFRTDTRFDGLMWGALTAWVVWRGVTPGATLRKLIGWIGAFGLIGVIYLATRELLQSGEAYHWAFTLANAFTASVILSVATGALRPVSWLLEQRWLRWVGTVSYGVYLWHWPVIRFMYDWQTNEFWGYMKTVLEIGVSFAIAAASYYLVEVHFLRLKDRLGKPRARMPLAAVN